MEYGSTWRNEVVYKMLVNRGGGIFSHFSSMRGTLISLVH